MDYESYTAIDAVNWSTLRAMAQSPLAYRYAAAHPREDTATFRLGRLTHMAILEPECFERDVCVYPGPVRRGREWDAFRAANASREIVTATEFALARCASEAALSHPVARHHLTGIAETEVVLTWTDAATKIDCKARVDRMTTQYLLEVKTAREVAPWPFGRQCAALKYHGQFAFYLDGARAAGRDLPGSPIVIAIQPEPPHDVAVYTVPDDVLDAGRELYRGLLNRLLRCRESGHWPGVCEGEIALQLPAWAYGEDDTPSTGIELDWGGL